jgi:hypothetical protein
MASVIGGLIGTNAGKQGYADATQDQQNALSQFQGVDVPTLDEQKVNYLLPEYVGDLNTQSESTMNMGPSEMGNIQVDPRLQQAQLGALDQLSQIGETGLMPGERAALDEARRQAAGEAQAKSAQIMSDMARRGMGGSGMELAARLQASQSSADRQQQANDDEMKMAQQRALDAINQKAGLATNMGNQQFQQQSDVAKAKDVINQFNTQNAQAVQARNVANANAATTRNMDTRQNLAGQAANVKNQQEQQNKGLYQTQFNNQMQRAGGMAGQYQQMAGTAMQNAKNTADMWSNIGGGVDKMASGAMGWNGPAAAATSDENAKENIHSIDVDKFLDSLSPYGYEYKDKSNGEGPRIGVMAQDVEKTPEGKMLVKDGPGGKMIDYSQSGGHIFASLADLHQRLKDLEGK